ncbi:hypothetical protein Pfo_025695 [Paulownia fortunei]|nr:hypothetical protein Pfo_025695 [Paulownia fortunei]
MNSCRVNMNKGKASVTQKDPFLYPKSFGFYQNILTYTGSIRVESTLRSGGEWAYSKAYVQRIISPEQWEDDLFRAKEITPDTKKPHLDSTPSALDQHAYVSMAQFSLASIQTLIVFCNLFSSNLPYKTDTVMGKSSIPRDLKALISVLRYVLADAQEARVSDFGKNDTIFNVRTHLGHLLNPGDYALGYDLYDANSNDMELDKYKGRGLPDVILNKKSYKEKRQKKRVKPRSWKLKSLNLEIDNAAKEMASMTDGEDVPSIPLDDLLADLDLCDEEVDDDGVRE